MQNALRCGTSGWSHSDWDSIVYPAIKPRGFHPIEFLSQHLDMVEIDTSFDQPLRPEISRLWLNKVSHRSNFQFSAILGRQFTYDRRLDPMSVAAFKEGLWPLRGAGKLGCLLMRYPAAFRFSVENRDFLIEVRRAFHEFPLVAELPHPSWTLDEALGVLMDYRVGFCNLDPSRGAVITSPVGYARLLGRKTADWAQTEPADYLYTPLELAQWQTQAERLRAHTTASFVVTANHVGGKAVVNAMQLKAMLGEAASPLSRRAQAMPPRRENVAQMESAQLFLKAG